jgi:hypothetical protein
MYAVDMVEYQPPTIALRNAMVFRISEDSRWRVASMLLVSIASLVWFKPPMWNMLAE